MDENTNTNTNAAEEIGAQTEPAAAEGKTYTQEEVLKLLQSETDKRVTAALKTQQKKHERELSLAKLDDEQRQRAEKDNLIAELKEELAQLRVEQNRSELKSVLASRGLSAEFADILSITDDIEQSQANIDRLDKLFKDAVKVEVEKRLAAAGGTPTGGRGAAPETMTPEKARKMTLADINELSVKNPELFAKLFEKKE